MRLYTHFTSNNFKLKKSYRDTPLASGFVAFSGFILFAILRRVHATCVRVLSTVLNIVRLEKFALANAVT